MSSSNDTGILLEPYLTPYHVIIYPTLTLTLMTLIYGVYIPTFISAVHSLVSRRKALASSNVYLIGSVSLFVLATLFTATEVWGLTRQAVIEFDAAKTRDYDRFRQYRIQDDAKTVWNGILDTSSPLMNTLADWMLIHRCCIVWNRNKIVLYSLVLIATVLNGLFLSTSLVEAASYNLPHLPIHIAVMVTQMTDNTVLAIAIFQVLLASMTGGRIWWISRQARKVLGSHINAKYWAIVAIIIESGVLYGSSRVIEQILIYVEVFQFRNFIDFSIISTLMSGLAPTLIIARVAQSKSVDNVEQAMSTLHFADGLNNPERSTDTEGGGHLRRQSLDNNGLAPVKIDKIVGPLPISQP
ncbi:hypothetical protein E1B28_003428 [Marasmius oreades]|uniref:Uncharacterized protein n=1 Tax=Marasmius oreades TaxID=181124 RepID=A0A9P7UNE2_9AGAR|nr:uncharacterized protein E1B28_003428 [Marasmius oreades]KAG7085894.1 hypothetical protein E1B28_003428 [Marasmius oreades]